MHLAENSNDGDYANQGMTQCVLYCIRGEMFVPVAWSPCVAS
jgi:hypothetical protein